MATHKDRMKEISYWTIPKKGSVQRASLDAYIEKNKNDKDHKKYIKEILNKSIAQITIQQETGSGFSADRQLREYNLEYNGRIIRGSLRDLPSSFNVVEAFNIFSPSTSTFLLREERDHLFSFEHFIDWFTSSKTNTDEKIKTLPENRIYSFNSTDIPSNLLFKCKNSQEFGFSSFSMIRTGNEISALLVAGEKCDLEAETRKIQSQLENIQAFAHRSHILPDTSLTPRAEPLKEDSSLWKTVVLIRLDINKKTIDARYIYKDCGVTYSAKTDDVSSFLDESGKFISEEARDSYKSQVEELQNYGTLIELCKTCLLIPSFFEAHDDDIAIQRHPTGFRDFKKLLKNKRTIERVDPAHCVTHREVSCIKRLLDTTPNRTTFEAPDFKIERSGHWRKLPLGYEGRDKSGNPVYGRSWVSQVLSWEEQNLTCDKLVASRNPTQPTGENPGFIYIMRSAAHAKDIFKVGLTQRTTSKRSEELSSGTSSPDIFLVLEEWATGDCIKAEKLIHSELEIYRINPKREFFKTKYSTIRSIVERVISSI